MESLQCLFSLKCGSKDRFVLCIEKNTVFLLSLALVDDVCELYNFVSLLEPEDLSHSVLKLKVKVIDVLPYTVLFEPMNYLGLLLLLLLIFLL